VLGPVRDQSPRRLGRPEAAGQPVRPGPLLLPGGHSRPARTLSRRRADSQSFPKVWIVP
jgi:hypothetical protein